MFQIRLILAALGLVAVLGAAAWLYGSGRSAGWSERDGECKVQIAEIESRAIAAEREAYSLQARTRALADKLATQAAAAQAELESTQQRMSSEINRLVRDRVALNRRLVSLLNDRNNKPAGDRQTTPATSVVAGAGAATPAADPDRQVDEGGASERSLATWIVGAQTLYGICATRLTALQDYVRVITN